MRPLSMILSIFPLLLTIISFTFTVLSTTSKQWAYQDFYSEGELLSPDQQITPLWTIYRSPFWTCGRPNNAQPGDYTTICTRHALTPFGHRACEGLVHTNLTLGINDPVYGDPRQCQQIHMAASLTASSSVFSGLALVSLLALTFLSLFSRHNHPNRHQAKPSPLTYLNAWIIFSLLISAGLLFIAQFYGILGLVQSAWPNGEYITNDAVTAQSGPWIQGKASVVYASVGWFGGVLGAVGSLWAWGVPRGVGAVDGGNGRGEKRGEEGREGDARED